MLRLTLRTLLAWLDDVLSPAEIHDIGQQVQEAPAAQQLIERIRKVARRRRLTVPEDTGPDGTDPNVVANYLDGALSPDDIRGYENKCLKSDVHLAEVASVHQILSLLGQKAKVPADARHRMYRLPKGKDVPSARREGAEAPFEPQPVARLTPATPAPEVPAPARHWAASLLGAAALLLMIGASGYYLSTPRAVPPKDKLALAQEEARAEVELAPEPGPEQPLPAAKAEAEAKKAEEAETPEEGAMEAEGAGTPEGEAEKEAQPDMKAEPASPDAEKKAQPDAAQPAAVAGGIGKLISGEGAILKAGADSDANWEALPPAASFAANERIATLTPSRFLAQLGSGEAVLWGGTELKVDPPGPAAARFELTSGQMTLKGVEGQKPYEIRIGPAALNLIIPPGHAVGLRRLSDPAASATGTIAPIVLLAFADEPIQAGIGDDPPKELAPGSYQVSLATRTFAPIRQPIPDWVATAELSPLEKEVAAQCKRYFAEKQPIGRSLTLALEDSNPIIRKAALQAAGTLGYIELVVARLDKERDPEDRRAAAETLRDLFVRDEDARKKVDEELLARFGDQTDTVRMLLLGISPEKAKDDPKTLTNLVSLLNFDSLAIRQLAIDNLTALTNRDDLGYDPDTRPQDSITEWAKVIRRKDNKQP